MFPIDNETCSHSGDTSQPIVHTWVDTQGVSRIKLCLYRVELIHKLSIETLMPRKYSQLSDVFKIQIAWSWDCETIKAELSFNLTPQGDSDVAIN